MGMETERCTGVGGGSHRWRPKRTKGKPWNPKCINCGLSRNAVVRRSTAKRCQHCGCLLGRSAADMFENRKARSWWLLRRSKLLSELL